MGRLHHFGPLLLIVAGLIALLIASQVFWLWKIRGWKQQILTRDKHKWLRPGLDVAGAAIYFVMMWYGFFGAHRAHSPTQMTLSNALLHAPFSWWFFGSLLGFILYMIVRALGLGLGLAFFAALWPFRARPKRKTETAAAAHASEEDSGSGELTSVAPAPAVSARPSRRHFFRQAATAAGLVPFAGAAYGILYGRLNLKITNPRIVLPNLPRAFDGFRILQLSDLHIGPFMSAREIGKIVEISNRARPDLIALTGDFVTWDPNTQYAVVEALSPLQAPYGVWGSLGNHEIWTHTEDSITRLFAARGFRILRQASAVIPEGRDSINLIGVDYETENAFGHYKAGFVRRYLESIKGLLLPEMVNILMSHNPNTFDRAAEMGIDLSLAGHTHGGQVNLEFLHADISPARLVTRYVEGWFQKNRRQLYVNRGIGTIGLPMRIGAPPEITIYHLVRGSTPALG
ncbi:MAG: metallophosphoesterase [Terriglobia bacterium]